MTLCERPGARDKHTCSMRLGSVVATSTPRAGWNDVNAGPWTVLDTTATDVESWRLRSGHVQVRVGTR